ncbi:MAG: energy-coupling factor ABC transporter ATP-binding protein [Cyanobacteriota bacterium]|jgi:cobalt/nickel transport system ATP-binding protein
MNPPALTLTNLCFSYGDGTDALRGVTLQINPGERWGLIGCNGSGKTTLFLLICGVLAPKAGEIELFNQQVKLGQFYPEIGLVFQNPDDQLFCPSVWEDIAFAPQNLGLSETEIQERVTSALAMTGIEALAQRPPHHLSGGEKRMAAIAGVLAMKPKMILYDEPSANLDHRARRRLIQFLQEASETLMISSHDLELILEVCDRTALLDGGKIMATGAPRQLLGERELMERYGLETPYSLR